MHCDVASGINLKVEHFLHLNRMEREKVIRYVFSEICEPILYKRMLRYRSALKKKQFVLHRKNEGGLR